MPTTEIIPYNQYLVLFARKLRNNPTRAEHHLWRYLKGKQMLEFDFDRQKPIDQYIVDFYCKEVRFAIELDGSSHDGREIQDGIRQHKLESFGIKFVRFRNEEVFDDIKSVLCEIEYWLKERGGLHG